MYRGVIVPLVTPVNSDGRVCEASVADLVETVRPHVTALLPALSTGEGWALHLRQWRDMLDYTVRYAGGRQVLAGILCSSTAEVVERLPLAADLGAHAVVVSTPFGAHTTQQEIYEHYRAIGEATDLPVVVYNESAVSGKSITLDTLLRICALPSVAAVKESSGNGGFTRRLVAAAPGVAVLQGREHLVAQSPGVDGYVLSLANVEPALCAAMFTAPSDRLAEQVMQACDAYGLLGPDWYRDIKNELCKRKVISHSGPLISWGDCYGRQGR